MRPSATDARRVLLFLYDVQWCMGRREKNVQGRDMSNVHHGTRRIFVALSLFAVVLEMTQPSHEWNMMVQTKRLIKYYTSLVKNV